MTAFTISAAAQDGSAGNSVPLLPHSGDINGDEIITSSDYITVKSYFNGLISLSPEEIEAADVNGDGRISTADYFLIKKNLNGEVPHPHVHDLIYHEGKEPTATEPGWKEYYTCSGCDYTTYEEIPALGYNLVPNSGDMNGDGIITSYDYLVVKSFFDGAASLSEDEIKAADVNNDGRVTTADYILIKRRMNGETPPVHVHDLIHHDGKSPTCTEPGWNEYDTCTGCDYTTYKMIPALGHEFIHHDAVAPTCTEPGCKEYDTCSRCDYTTFEEVPASGHKLVHHSGKEPTCTEPGWKDYDTCTRCDHTTYEAIPATGHNWIETRTEPSPVFAYGEDEYPSECIGWNTGSIRRYCENCSEAVETPVLVPLGLRNLSEETVVLEGNHMTIDLGKGPAFYSQTMAEYYNGNNLRTVEDIIKRWTGVVPYTQEFAGWYYDITSVYEYYIVALNKYTLQGSYDFADPAQKSIQLTGFDGDSLDVHMIFTPADTSTFAVQDDIVVTLLFPREPELGNVTPGDDGVYIYSKAMFTDMLSNDPLYEGETRIPLSYISPEMDMRLYAYIDDPVSGRLEDAVIYWDDDYSRVNAVSIKSGSTFKIRIDCDTLPSRTVTIRIK